MFRDIKGEIRMSRKHLEVTKSEILFCEWEIAHFPNIAIDIVTPSENNYRNKKKYKTICDYVRVN
jgi:hypothetical protein